MCVRSAVQPDVAPSPVQRRSLHSKDPTMGSHILMNVLDEQELRVGVIRDGRLDALIHERIGEGQHLGNIYKARVANVEPSLDAAFLDTPRSGC